MHSMNKIISWAGTVASIVGSFAVAGHFFLLGYLAFLAGAGALLTVFVKNRDWSQIMLQCFFLVANLIGLYNALV
jgi:hypothetical protein